jgi:acyl carrier protein
MQLQDSQSTLDAVKVKHSPVDALQNWLVSQLSGQLSLDPTAIKVTEPLTRYGLDSIDAVTLVGDLEDWLDLELPDTLFWDHPSISQASAFLVENFEVEAAIANISNSPVPAPAAPPEAAAATEKKGWGNLLGRFK